MCRLPVAWLFAGRVDLLSRAAAHAIEQHDVLVSPMVVLELQHLIVTRAALRGRVPVTRHTAIRRHHRHAVW